MENANGFSISKDVMENVQISLLKGPIETRLK